MANMASLQTAKFAKKRSIFKANWPILLGSLIILFVLFAAIAGQTLAPRDPTEQNMIFQDSAGEWHVPPFPAFQLKEFPLGADRFGRDLFSQLLFAIRPTLILVVIVGSVRLLFGLVIGLIAGWSNSRLARILNQLINTAVTIPPIIVALAAIAAVGPDLGVWAFVIGLSITGWADSAQLVREHTRVIRGQIYIEASRAMGANTTQIMGRHILRQIMPLVWMLLTFEISSTLMTTAGLGFLGYYIGGDAFIRVDDSVAARVAAQFELGQMLATTSEISTEPWGMVAAGSTVFFAVLGFNLFGEGLRQRLLLGELHNRSIISRWFARFGSWADDHILPGFYRASEHRSFWPLTAVFTILLLFGGNHYWQWRLDQAAIVQQEQIVLSVPGDQIWAAEDHDAYGTRWSPYEGPIQPEVIWDLQLESSFSGGPVINKEGTLFITTEDGQLISINPETGEIIWQKQLDFEPVGTPALDAVGDIYLVDTLGGLSKFAPSGTMIWHYELEIKASSENGPIVTPDNIIFYTIGGIVQAVNADGTPLWRTVTHYFPLTFIPRLSPNDDVIYQREVVLDIHTGQIIPVEDTLTANLDVSTKSPVQLVDMGGRTHYYLGNAVVRWHMENGEPVVEGATTWPAGNFGLGTTRNTGITPNNAFWAFFTGERFDSTLLIWLDLDGSVIGTARWIHRPSFLVAIDRASRFYACGTVGLQLECRIYQQGDKDPYWQINLERNGQVIGGALAPGVIYISTSNGQLIALSDIQSEAPSP